MKSGDSFSHKHLQSVNFIRYVASNATSISGDYKCIYIICLCDREFFRNQTQRRNIYWNMNHFAKISTNSYKSMTSMYIEGFVRRTPTIAEYLYICLFAKTRKRV